jgi:Ca2+:H+ antiporter
LKPSLLWLLVFVPVSIVAEVLHANKILIFVSSAIAIIPLAGLMGRATEHIAQRAGESLGGLLNATFGNAAELIIAIMALREGLGSPDKMALMQDVVKASLTGSIIGNILLVLGLSVLAGGMRYKQQSFNPTAASVGATMLTLAAIGLSVPAAFTYIGRSGGEVFHLGDLSLFIAFVLIATYTMSLFFSLVTHRHLYVGAGGGHGEDDKGHEKGWSFRRSVIILLVATALVGLISEFLVGAIEETAMAFGLTEIFVGVIVLAIISRWKF